MNQIQPLNPDSRFWSHVQKSDGCWTWTAARNRDGYGTVAFRDGGQRVHMMAHRYSWKLANGEIPKGLLVLHECDNPACVRPDHLFLGTDLDNMRDMSAKGRGRPKRTPPKQRTQKQGYRRTGDRHPNAKLTDEQIRKMRAEYVGGGSVEHQRLADMYGVCRRLVRAILSGDYRSAA